jgi:plastocyanin
MSAALVAALALATTPVDIPGRYFDPPRVTVAPGGTVVWRSHDGEPHTVVAAGGAFASGILTRHGEFAQRFDTPGSFPYVCSLHPFMRGTVEVAAAAAPVPGAAAAVTLAGERHRHHVRLTGRVSPPRKGAVLALELHFRDRYAWRQVAHRRLGAAGAARFSLRGNIRRRARVVLYEDGVAVATSRALRPWTLPDKSPT